MQLAAEWIGVEGGGGPEFSAVVVNPATIETRPS